MSTTLQTAEAEAAAISTTDQPLGGLGPRFNRRSPFLVGMAAAAGVAVTYGLVLAVTDARSALTLIGVALFLAIGLDPVVSWLVKHHCPRWAAVTVVSLTALATIAGLLAVAIPPLAQQASQLVSQAPDYLRQAQNHSSTLGQFNERFHLQQHLTDALNGSTVLGGLVSAATVIVTAVTDILIGAVLTIFFLANMPQIRATFYRLIPGSRRPRAILLGDEILGKVGAYVLGNVVISVITAVGTLIWLEIFSVPYPLLLAIFVALFDLIPVVGSTIAGVVVAAVALTVSLPVCLATIVFFIVYRLLEDYLLVPRIIGRAVEVPALVTVVAVLLGGAVFGIIGALVAIPVAAALQLLAKELLFPRLDRA
ncbi:MAG: AI-2E family transporter [Mycobacteriaceae bacterium]